MALSQWRGKKRTRNRSGLTILEILLALILTATVASAAVVVHRSKVKVKKENDCAERKWRWLKAMDEIEFQLRRWEMLAPNCIAAGFNPVIPRSDGHLEMFEIDSVRPTVRPMKFPNYLEVPSEHLFASGRPFMLCNREVTMRGTINQAHPSTKDRPSVLEVSYEENASPPLMDEGASVVTFQSVTFETGAAEATADRRLYKRTADDNKRLVTSGFEGIESKAVQKPEGTIEAFLKISKEECQIESKFEISGRENISKQGQWFLGSNELFYRPWMNEQAKVEE